MKRLVFLGVANLPSGQMLLAAETLSQGEVVRIALRDNASIKAARRQMGNDESARTAGGGVGRFAVWN